ncbi:MAG: hypothetical protein E6180_08920, partial [Varibaculum cambriense]|nr:hypothetical protein [Varibaculum cambriense]
MRRNRTFLTLAAGAVAYPFLEARLPRLRRYQLGKNPGQVPAATCEDYLPSRVINVESTGKNRRADSSSPSISADNSSWQLRILHLSDLHLWSGSSWLA